MSSSSINKLSDRLIVLNEFSNATCLQDTGNPGVIDGKLAALMIFNYESACELSDNPTLFTGIEYYYEWIRNYVGQERLEEFPDLS